MGSSNRDNESDTDFNEPKTDQESDFIEGEKVLAYHGPCIYKAKVQKVELSREEGKYYVHYLGWNKSWDEWVEIDRLLKFTEENIEKQETQNKKQGGDKNPKSGGRSTQSKPKSSTEARAEKEDLKNYGTTNFAFSMKFGVYLPLVF
ncbi:hypothetical protein IFM89_005071 [Coptis chinensis]|uniref:Chromo domain-containing protein n=1 Tax=Coptis chinensis TaxID=261450 RepID=A0A835LPP2_9MAGN|nr:hypothetical protein IFM89_005071 [Coptis chinensis]